jgi:hypothetical protein
MERSYTSGKDYRRLREFSEKKEKSVRRESPRRWKKMGS